MCRIDAFTPEMDGFQWRIVCTSQEAERVIMPCRRAASSRVQLRLLPLRALVSSIMPLILYLSTFLSLRRHAFNLTELQYNTCSHYEPRLQSVPDHLRLSPPCQLVRCSLQCQQPNRYDLNASRNLERAVGLWAMGTYKCVFIRSFCAPSNASRA